MIAIFLTDIMFALDSIPAIFGLTQETYLVITPSAFALMGLRQMFFLLDGLPDRLIYLSLGLAVTSGSSASADQRGLAEQPMTDLVKQIHQAMWRPEYPAFEPVPT